MGRRVFVIIEVDDDKAIAEDKGTGEYLEREFGWLEQSGIDLKHWLIADNDDTERWARYINYLIEWAFKHSGEEHKGMYPVSYDYWCNNGEGSSDFERAKIENALQCLNNNGIDKSECPEVLRALCYVLYDAEIEDLLEDGDYDD